MNYNDTERLYSLLNSYHDGKITLFDLLDDSMTFFDSIRGVCSWLTIDGKKEFDGYHFDDLVDYYLSCLP